MQKKGALTPPPPRFEAGFEAIERARDKEGGASSVSLFSFPPPPPPPPPCCTTECKGKKGKA